jgi:hypothetical protein
LDDGKISRLTMLKGRRGSVGNVFAAGDRYLYFTWREDVGSTTRTSGSRAKRQALDVLNAARRAAPGNGS